MHQREGLTDPKRLKLVGFVSADGKAIRAGAHLVAANDASTPPKSLGHITSTAYSPALEKYIALGLLEDGPERIGQNLIATYPLKNVDETGRAHGELQTLMRTSYAVFRSKQNNKEP